MNTNNKHASCKDLSFPRRSLYYESKQQIKEQKLALLDLQQMNLLNKRMVHGKRIHYGITVLFGVSKIK
jgi:hypothetical protein